MSSPVVLISAALTEIGRASALAFAEEGVRIVLSGGHAEDVQRLVAEVRALGAEAEFIRANVRNKDEVRDLIDKTMVRFGCLDVAINIAGIEDEPGPPTEYSAESYASTLDTHYRGTVLSMMHQLDVMLPESHGTIINVSPIYGRIAAGASLYCITRHAFVGLTKSATLQLDVRRDAINPAPRIYTTFTGVDDRQRAFVSTAPLLFSGRPEEIARAIVFLASE